MPLMVSTAIKICTTSVQRMDEVSRKELEEAFAAFLPVPGTTDQHLQAALRHVLQNPGRLIRPQLVIAMADAFEVPHLRAKDLAVALEYFHTASLLIDDLPCMDNATERRGAACVHVRYGETGAILTALALINRAYALTWRAVSDCPGERRSRALAFIENYLGVGGLLNGQSLDLNYSALPHDQETNNRIARGKTVSLVRLALVTPALLGAASAREVRLLERISVYWGLSYQIADDLKDVLETSQHTGKTSSRDIMLDRSNLAVAIGVPGAVKRLRRLMGLGDRVLAQLLLWRPGVSFLEKLRGDLEEETARILQGVCEAATG